MSFPVPIAGDSVPPEPPPRWEGDDLDAFLAEQDSFGRAMPIQRLIGSGMQYSDARTLHAAAEARVRWEDCGEWLGHRNLRFAATATTTASIQRWLRFASACFRAAQAAIPSDTDRKRAIFAKMVASFGTAATFDEPATTKHEIPWNGGALCGWLMRPADRPKAPVVIIMGGFDGWREEYLPGALALVERGVAAFLVDGPGQGETRLFQGLYLDATFPDAFACIADHLAARDDVGPRVGIWGNSLGGFLAAKSVAAQPNRFDALCVNGGTVRPLELPERFPRFFEKVEAILGTTDRAAIIETMGAMELDADAAAIRCPLLQLHSVPDQVFLLENARRIHDGASSADKQLLVWEDGDHCLYNHSDEKNCLVADWFADRLGDVTKDKL